jgi:hypothetical protein
MLAIDAMVQLMQGLINQPADQILNLSDGRTVIVVQVAGNKTRVLGFSL